MSKAQTHADLIEYIDTLISQYYHARPRNGTKMISEKEMNLEELLEHGANPSTDAASIPRRAQSLSVRWDTAAGLWHH